LLAIGVEQEKSELIGSEYALQTLREGDGGTCACCEGANMFWVGSFGVAPAEKISAARNPRCAQSIPEPEVPGLKALKNLLPETRASVSAELPHAVLQVRLL